MFGLIYGLWSQWTRKDECQVLLIGLDGAGKTTLLERLKADFGAGSRSTFDPSVVTRTIGMNMGKMELEARSLVVRDLGGMEGLRGLWEKYYIDTDVVVFVLDAVERDRWEEARSVLESVLMNGALAGVPVIIAVNKQDMLGSPMRPSEVTTALGIGRREQREVQVQPVSALKGSGIRQLVEWIGGHKREKRG